MRELSIKEILNNIPSSVLRNDKLDIIDKKRIIPFVSGYFRIDFDPPKFLNNGALFSFIQDDIINAIPKLKEKYNKVSKFITQMTDNYGHKWLSHFITDISFADDNVNLVQNQKSSLAEIYPGTVVMNQELSMTFKVDIDVDIYDFLETWNEVIYHPIIGQSLLKEQYYKKDYYSANLELYIYKPNLKDIVYVAKAKYILPSSKPTFMQNFKYEGGEVKYLNMNFLYQVEV